MLTIVREVSVLSLIQSFIQPKLKLDYHLLRPIVIIITVTIIKMIIPIIKNTYESYLAYRQIVEDCRDLYL